MLYSHTELFFVAVVYLLVGVILAVNSFKHMAYWVSLSLVFFWPIFVVGGFIATIIVNVFINPIIWIIYRVRGKKK